MHRRYSANISLWHRLESRGSKKDRHRGGVVPGLRNAATLTWEDQNDNQRDAIRTAERIYRIALVASYLVPTPETRTLVLQLTGAGVLPIDDFGDPLDQTGARGIASPLKQNDPAFARSAASDRFPRPRSDRKCRRHMPPPSLPVKNPRLKT